MANIIQFKRSSVAGKLPNVSDLQVGELALNLADGIIYTKNTVGNVIIVGSSTTSNIREGSNLYFTNDRVYANVSPLISVAFNQANTAFAQSNVAFAQANVAFNTSNVRLLTKANVADLTTANVTEVTNQYFTNARALAAVANTNLILANLTTTGNLTVGSGIGGNITGVNNLYATNVYSNTIIANVWSGIYTANVVETSGNLYFTNTRVVSALTAGFGIVIAANGRLTVTATGSGNYNDANTYSNVILLGYATNSRIDGLTTSDIAEGSNLYFDNTRAVSAFTAGTGISLASNGLITSTATSAGNFFIDYGFIYDPIITGQQDFGSIA